MSEIKVNKVTPRSGTTVTVGDGAGEIVTIDAATVNLGRCGGTVVLTCGATSSGFGAITWCASIKTAAFCAAAGKGYFVNTCGGAITATLPASASVGDQINFTDYARTWDAACKALTLDQNSLNFQGNTCPNPIYDTDGATVKIVYSGATQGWIPQLDKGTALETPQTYNIRYLVVAGGGGGGYDRAAGGGAGGYRTVATKSFAVSPCTTIPVTVGGGGTAGGPGGGGTPEDKGGDGVDSVFSTITSAGGGGGGKGAFSDPCSLGNPGGSGGGSSGPTGCAPGGSGNTPSVSPPQGNDGGDGNPAVPGYWSGGGGGAACAGQPGQPGGGGNGGNGSPTDIMGSIPQAPTYGTPGPAPGRYFAGGGGGSGQHSSTQPVGTGGAGGGGNGAATGGGCAGTTNTGGAGGGDSNAGPGNGGVGGSGIVIIRRLTACSTSTSGDVVATCGSDTIHIFTGTGTFVT